MLPMLPHSIEDIDSIENKTMNGSTIPALLKRLRGTRSTDHQTGAKLRKGGREYQIPRKLQHSQAKKAVLDFDGEKMVGWD